MKTDSWRTCYTTCGNSVVPLNYSAIIIKQYLLSAALKFVINSETERCVLRMYLDMVTLGKSIITRGQLKGSCFAQRTFFFMDVFVASGKRIFVYLEKLRSITNWWRWFPLIFQDTSYRKFHFEVISSDVYRFCISSSDTLVSTF